MMALAARFMQAVSSTSTGGLPGPAQMARLPVCIAAFTTPGPPVTQQQADGLVAADGVEGLERRLLDDGDEVLDAGFARDGLVVGAHRHGGAFRGGRMRVEDHRVAGGDDVDDVAAQRRDGMRGRRDRADDAEGRVLLQRDAVVAAAAVGMQPLDAGHELDDLQLLDLVIEPADLRLLQLDAAPLGGVRLRHGL